MKKPDWKAEIARRLPGEWDERDVLSELLPDAIDANDRTGLYRAVADLYGLPAAEIKAMVLKIEAAWDREDKEQAADRVVDLIERRRK